MSFDDLFAGQKAEKKVDKYAQLPAGDYKAVITECDYTEQHEPHKIFKMKLEVAGGKHDGVEFENAYFINYDFNRDRLMSDCMLLGVLNEGETLTSRIVTKLQNKVADCKVSYKTYKKGIERMNVWFKEKPLDGPKIDEDAEIPF